MSDELPSYPRRTEKLHSFNKEAGFQLLLKGQKKITFLHELDSHITYFNSTKLQCYNQLMKAIKQHVIQLSLCLRRSA